MAGDSSCGVSPGIACPFHFYHLLQIARPSIPVRLSLGEAHIRLLNFFNSDAVATDIVHQHSNRLDYYKG